MQDFNAYLSFDIILNQHTELMLELKTDQRLQK